MASELREPVPHPFHNLPSSHTPDSPARIKPAQSAPEGLNTEAKREFMIEELGEAVPAVDVDNFLALLPPLQKGIDVKSIVQKLRRNRTITPRTASAPGRWAQFPDNPAEMEPHEDKVFADFDKITTEIAKTLPKHTATIRFVCNPKAVPVSRMRDNKSKPDCYGILKEEDENNASPPLWCNILIAAEFKKKYLSADINDVR